METGSHGYELQQQWRPEVRTPRNREFAAALGQNERAKKMLFLVATDAFPDPEQAKRIDPDAVLEELRGRLPTPEDIWHEVVRRVGTIEVTRDPRQTDREHRDAVFQKREEYLQEVRAVFGDLFQVYEKEGALPTEENITRITTGLREASAAAERGNVDPTTVEHAQRLLKAAGKQELSPAQASEILAESRRLFFACREKGIPWDVRPIQGVIDRLRETAEAQPEQERPEVQIETKEFHPDAATTETMQAFVAFVERDRQKIKDLWLKGRATADAVYDLFYSEDENAKDKRVDGDPAFLREQQEYAKLSQQTEQRMNKWMESLKTIGRSIHIMQATDMKEEGWLYYKSLGGFDHRRPIGRLYLDVEVLRAPEILQGVMEKMYNAGLHAEAKAPLTASAGDFNRADKVVIYFNDKEAAQVMRLLESVHAEHADAFLDPTPKFSAALRDSEGNVLRGVGFGENPEGRKSFGEVRSEILAELYDDAAQENMSLQDPSFQLARRFQDACRRRNVDPEHAAFNANSKGFDVIKSRAA